MQQNYTELLMIFGIKTLSLGIFLRMINSVNYRPIEAYYFKTKEWLPDTSVNYFTFIYIVSGQGTHFYQDHSFSFAPGYFVVSTPEKGHSFKMEKEVGFLLMQFHISTILYYPWKSITALDKLLCSASQASGRIKFTGEDKILVSAITTSLVFSLITKRLYYRELNIAYIDAILIIAARNLSKHKPETFADTTDNKIEDILSYIEENIHQPEMLTIKNICAEFGISANYFSTYFKQHCGVKFKDYTNDYRLRLIEHRIKYSDKRVGEIVMEFGFTDESHLNKFFKSQKGVSISKFREALRSK